jgi:hypothetical protein
MATARTGTKLNLDGAGCGNINKVTDSEVGLLP